MYSLKRSPEKCLKITPMFLLYLTQKQFYSEVQKYLWNGLYMIKKACGSGGSPRTFSQLRHNALYRWRASTAPTSAHTASATSDSQPRLREEGSHSQHREAESGSGIGGAGKTAAGQEVGENLPSRGEGGTRAPPAFPRRPLRIACLPPVHFSNQMGFRLRQWSWEALLKISQKRLGFVLPHNPVSLLHTLPSGHRAVSFGWESGGQRPGLRAHQTSLFSFFRTKTLPAPLHRSSQERPRGSHSPRCGDRGLLGGLQPGGFPVSVPAGLELRRRLGEIWERGNPPRGPAPQSRIRVFSEACSKASGTSALGKHPPSPRSPASGAKRSGKFGTGRGGEWGHLWRSSS